MSLVADVADLARDHGMWWPDGDPGGCRELAHAWQAAAAACDFAAEDAAHGLRRVRVDNHGRAIDAFEEHIHDVVDALRTHADRCREVADRLLRRADQIDQARIEIEIKAATIATSVIAGAALGIFTAGLSAALAAEATALVIAEAAAFEIAISEAAAVLIGEIVAYAAIGAFEGAVTDVATQTESALIQNKNPLTSFSFKELGFSGLSGAFDGAFSGLTKFRPALSVADGPDSWDDIADRLAQLPTGRSSKVRIVDTDEDVLRMFDHLKSNGTPHTWTRYDGDVYRLADGTELGLREHSTSGGWTIDIVAPDSRRAKVHRR